MRKLNKPIKKAHKRKGLAMFKMASFFVFFILALRKGKYLIALISFLGFTISGLELFPIPPKLAHVLDISNSLYIVSCFAFYTFWTLFDSIFKKN